MSGDLPTSLLRQFAAVVGPAHVLTGEAAAGYAVDWTGGFTGHAPAVLRPGGTGEVAALLALCAGAGVAVVPQGGNTGLAGGGVPLHGEVVLSLARLDRLSPVDLDAGQVTAGAGVSLQQVADADPGLDLGVFIASRHSATVGGAVATNAGGLRVLRHGPMRAQLRGIEAVLSDGTVLSHMSGLVKDNTGYDYPSLLAGSEGTLAVITAARLQLVPRLADPVTVIVGADGPGEVHALARRAVREVGGLLSAEFFTQAGLDLLAGHAGLALPLRPPTPAYLLLEAAGPGAAEELAGLVGDRPAAVGTDAAGRARLWACRERHPEAAGFVGVPLKLDVSVPAARWVRLASEVAGVVAEADPGALVITYGHVADGNLHVNVVPGTGLAGGPPEGPHRIGSRNADSTRAALQADTPGAAGADGRHQDAVFSFVASLGGSISAEHGIGALKARWLPLVRSDAERALFARLRAAFDPAGILNPHVLPR
ncbi:MAG TPA: FAD-binding oxidoreductase [Streptosporangiaceae bacterium]|jgi:FAD/FMN-containing dehydrogenase